MIPGDYLDRNLEDFPFIPPPPSFVIPDWATPYEGDDESCFVDTRHVPNDVPHDNIPHDVPVVVPNEVPNDFTSIVNKTVSQGILTISD